VVNSVFTAKLRAGGKAWVIRLEPEQYSIKRDSILNILQKYFLREWLWTFLAVTSILLIVMIGVTLGELLNDIAGGRMPIGLMGALMLLKLPHVLITIIPLGIFVAVIWGLGRIYRDQEMAVMRSSGFNWQMMLRPLFNLLLPISALLLAMNLFLSPKAANLAQLQLEEAFKTAAEWGFQSGQFHVLSGGDLVLYVEAVEKDGRTLRNIFIQQRQGEREQVWIAEKGYYWLDQETAERYLTLENGQITEGGVKTLDFGVLNFSRNDLRLPEIERRNKEVDLEARPSGEILFSSDKEEIAEIQWRVSPAIAIIVLGMLAIPLAHSSPREGRGGRIVLGILTYVVYANMLYMCRSWLSKGELSPWLGMWWVHLLAFVIAVVWLQRQGRIVGKG
jgi:lipopolysaccharide export system permease protein